MKKGSGTKGHLNLTINEQILKKFKEYCEKNSINKSDWIEKRIKEFLEVKK